MLVIKIIMINLSICQLYVGNQNNLVMCLSVDASYMPVIKLIIMNLSVDVIYLLVIKIITINLSICQLYVGHQTNSVFQLMSAICQSSK